MVGDQSTLGQCVGLLSASPLSHKGHFLRISSFGSLCFALVEEEMAPESHIFSNPDPSAGSSFSEDLPGLIHSTPAAPASSLTEEQQRRMELNRRRALEKKLARQQQQQHAGQNAIFFLIP